MAYVPSFREFFGQFLLTLTLAFLSVLISVLIFGCLVYLGQRNIIGPPPPSTYDEMIDKHYEGRLFDRRDIPPTITCHRCRFEYHRNHQRRNVRFNSDNFHQFNSLDFTVYERFVELLTTLNLHKFRRTSKINFIRTLDIRTLEYSIFFINPTLFNENGDVSVVNYKKEWVASYLTKKKNQLLSSKFSEFSIRCDHMLIYRDSSKNHNLKLDKKYKILSLICPPYRFNRNYKAIFEKFYHPGIKMISLTIIQDFKDLLDFDTLNGFLLLCNTIKKINISFDYSILISQNVMVNVTQLKSDWSNEKVVAELQKWIGTRPDLESFNFHYRNSSYLLDKDRKLKSLHKIGQNEYCCKEGQFEWRQFKDHLNNHIHCLDYQLYFRTIQKCRNCI